MPGLSIVTGIEQKVNHLNPASWKGDVQVSVIQLMSAWKSGQHLVESDPKLAMFKPAEKFDVLESTPGTNLLNPFGMETTYEDQCGEETYNGIAQQTQSNPSAPFIPNSLELEELIDGKNVQKMDWRVQLTWVMGSVYTR